MKAVPKNADSSKYSRIKTIQYKTDSNKIKRLALITALMVLILGVRIFYSTGPIFANTQDEGIYLNIFANAVLFNNTVGFSQYKNVNLSNFSQCECNPADIFQFYVGFVYPEILVLKTLGFSANIAIYYVILTSIVEGLFIFLILEHISGARPATLGIILFAFLPMNILFSTHIQPLIPSMMFATVAIYAFILAIEKGRKMHYALAGAFAGLSYITNPLGALFLIFFTLVIAARAFNGKTKAIAGIIGLLPLLIGFLAAYSLIGCVYFIQTGNYLLYPSLTHAVYLLQEATQPQTVQCISGNLCLDYNVGYPGFYPSILADSSVSTIEPFMRYFSISIYLMLPLAAVTILRKKRNVWAVTMALMFGFLLLCIMLFPANIGINKGVITYYPIDEQPYLATVLTVPMIVIMALGLDVLLKNGKRLAILVAIVIIVTAVAFDMADLNNDVGYYRASMYTLHSFINFVSAHPLPQYHGSPLFMSEANLVSGYKYNISEQESCNSSYLNSLPDNSYVVFGGTVSLDISPEYMASFDNCIERNLTGYSLVDTVSNPLSNYSGLYAPSLEIFKKQ